MSDKWAWGGLLFVIVLSGLIHRPASKSGGAAHSVAPDTTASVSLTTATTTLVGPPETTCTATPALPAGTFTKDQIITSGTLLIAVDDAGTLKPVRPTPAPTASCWPDEDGYSPTHRIPLPVRSAARGHKNVEFIRLEVPSDSAAVMIEVVPVDTRTEETTDAE